MLTNHERTLVEHQRAVENREAMRLVRNSRRHERLMALRGPTDTPAKRKSRPHVARYIYFPWEVYIDRSKAGVPYFTNIVSQRGAIVATSWSDKWNYEYRESKATKPILREG